MVKGEDYSLLTMIEIESKDGLERFGLLNY